MSFPAMWAALFCGVSAFLAINPALATVDVSLRSNCVDAEELVMELNAAMDAAYVTFDPARCSETALKRALEQAGFSLAGTR